MMKDELMIKCLENSLWAQYIIEFFKFVGFAVSKETYGDFAKNKEEKSEKPFIETKVYFPEDSSGNEKLKQHCESFKSKQLNILISNAARLIQQNEEMNISWDFSQKTDCVSPIHDENSRFDVVSIPYSNERDDNEIQKKKKEIINSNKISIINICVDETEFWSTEIRKSIINALLNEFLNGLNDAEQDRDILRDLYSEYEHYNVFFHLYNEGIIKYTEDYYNGSGKSNGFKDVIKKVCVSSKEELTKCFEALLGKLQTEENQYNDNKYVRYAVLLLKYKINDLSYLIDKKNTFWPKKMLKEIDEIIEKDHLFMRAYYLAAMICRRDYQFNNSFIYYINKALEAVDNGEYSKETKSFLYYQKGKYYEEHYYSMDQIKEAYERSLEFDKNSCFAKYKIAEYAYQSGKKDEVDKAINELNDLEQKIVDHFDEEKLMPKSRIHGFRCCVFLGNIAYNLHHFDTAKEYYEKAIKLAIKQSKYFENKKDDWKQVFYMCMPLTPITRNMIHIYGSEQETSNEAEKLRRIFFKEKLENELKEYWITRMA